MKDKMIHILLVEDDEVDVLNMPKMNGVEFWRELRGDVNLKHIPVVVLTTSNEDRDKAEADNLNVAGYIFKPVTFANFSPGDGNAKSLLDVE
jgi:DNA-binding NarL/FixJ family response regulator